MPSSSSSPLWSDWSRGILINNQIYALQAPTWQDANKEDTGPDLGRWFSVHQLWKSVFIGPESDHCLPLSLTHWLTNWLLFSKLDWCDPGMWRCHTKLVEVVTVADADDENRVGNSLLQIWKLRFGHKAKLLFRLWAQDLAKILKLNFRQDFAADVWLGFNVESWSRLWS